MEDATKECTAMFLLVSFSLTVIKGVEEEDDRLFMCY